MKKIQLKKFDLKKIRFENQVKIFNPNKTRRVNGFEWVKSSKNNKKF